MRIFIGNLVHDSSEVFNARKTSGLVPDVAEAIEFDALFLKHEVYGRAALEALGRICAAEPQGFGYMVFLSIQTSVHLRRHVPLPTKKDSPWSPVASAVLDVLSNAVALWRIPRCSRCGRSLGEHGAMILPELLPAPKQGRNRRKREAEHERRAYLEREYADVPFVAALDCGLFLQFPRWFYVARTLPYPASVETFAAAKQIIRKIAVGYLRRCLREYNRPAGKRRHAIPKVIVKEISAALRNGRLVLFDDPDTAGFVRDTATDIVRCAERLVKVGRSGAGLGLVLRDGNVAFDVA